jgi:hypothetical protein
MSNTGNPMSPTIRRTAGLCALVALLLQGAASQQGSLHGRIVDQKRLPFSGAHIRLVDAADTLHVFLTEASQDGSFLLTQIPHGTYRLEVSAIGYARVTRTLRITGGTTEAGTIVLEEEPIAFGEVIVQGRVPAAVQNGDTTEYLARAFKTNPDATAEDLLTKMPGITVDNGTVRAGGENIQRVLVDGRPFFGDDPTLALRNLPAEVIDRIQLFDQMSDQAQFTGFDDGQSVRSLNIITRRERRNSDFGKITSGYGDDHRYEVGGSFNFFQGNRRVSLLGLSNNINEQNFTAQDLLGLSNASNQMRSAGQGPFRGRAGVGTRRGQGSFSQGAGRGPNPFSAAQLQGINTTHMLGGNGSDSLADDLFAQGSYFFNRTDNENQQALRRTYLLGGDSTSLYDQNTDASSRNFNHRINARAVYTPDATNSLLLLPQLYFQSNSADNSLDATTAQLSLRSASQSTTSMLNTGYDLGGHLVLRHKFELPGRTISLDLGLENTRKKTDGVLSSLTESSTGSTLLSDTADQQSDYLSSGRTFSANLIYTEPASVDGLLQVSYAPSYSESNAEKSTFDFDPLTGGYTTPDLPLSNVYANRYWTQSAGIGYRHRTSSLNMMAGLSYQLASLHGTLTARTGGEVDRSFATLLPNALLLYTMPDRSSLRVIYRATTRPPSVTQLQRVIDNSNPLLLSTGNPALDQSTTHVLAIRYSVTAPERARSLFILLSATMTRNYIANATVLPAKDTVLSDGTALSPGMQLTSPVNLNGYWNLRSFFTYGFPFDLLGSTLNFNSGLTFTRTPGLVNALGNISNAYALSEGFVLGSNISENFDFTLSYMGNLTIARNTLQAEANSNSYSHSASLRWSWMLGEGIVLRNDLKNSLTSGQSAGYNQNILLWNISLAKKLFRDQQGEVKVGVADLLGENKSISRAVTESYLEDTRNEALTRYVMVNFTYTIR